MNEIIEKEESIKNLSQEEKDILISAKSMGFLQDLNRYEAIQFAKISSLLKLNILKREIYTVKYGNQFNIIVGYQTYVQRAYKTGQVDYYETIINDKNEKGEILPVDKWSADFIIKRKDSSKEQKFTIYYEEFAPAYGNNFWKTKPKLMLEKCAIANGFRKSFPIELGDMPYTSEELWYRTKENDEIIEQNIIESEK